MSEEQEELVNQAPEVELEVAPKETAPTEQAPQLSAREREAMEMGWRPKDQWTGDPEDWVDARTFVRNGEFMGKIHNLNRQNKDLHKSLEDMKNMLSSAEQKGREAAIAELKSAKVQALQHGDYEKVASIDEQIMEAKAEAKVAAKQEVKDPYIEYAQETWFKDNQWFAADSELRDEFETVIRGHIAKGVQNGQAPDPEAAFKYATTRIKKMYPEKFGTKAPASQSVASSSMTTKPGPKKQQVSWSDLPEHMQKTGMRFIQQKLYKSKEDYIEDCIKTGAFK